MYDGSAGCRSFTHATSPVFSDTCDCTSRSCRDAIPPSAFISSEVHVGTKRGVITGTAGGPRGAAPAPSAPARSIESTKRSVSATLSAVLSQ